MGNAWFCRFLTSRTVIRLCARISLWNLACTSMTLRTKVHPNLIAWAWKQAELETIFERDQILGESMVLHIPHLLYCDSPPCKNLSIKLGMHINDLKNQRPSKFDSMSTEIGWVRNDFWERWNYEQKHGVACSSPVVLWFASVTEFVYETWHVHQQQHDPTSI